MPMPSKYSEELAELICDRISEGDSLRTICAEEARLPNRQTVFSWLSKHEEFRAQYAAAREAAADLIAEEIIAIADQAVDRDNAQAIAVRVDARKWIASKLKPKVYGNIAAVQHTGPEGGPLKVIIQGDDANL